MGIFFYVYLLKTNNICLVILHFLNNNLVVTLNSGNAGAINNQLISWADVLLLHPQSGIIRAFILNEGV